MQVYSLEPQPMCRKMIDHYLEENHMRHRVTVLNKSAEEVLPEDFNDQKVLWLKNMYPWQYQCLFHSKVVSLKDIYLWLLFKG